MKCSKCGSENSGSPKFCSDCGAKFVPIAEPIRVPGDEKDLYYCYRHKSEPTRVTCGRCGRPLCTRCIKMSSVGPRCKQCARGKVAVRPMGVLHDAAGGLSNVTQSRAWYLVIWLVVINLLSGLFGGRRNF
jgi:hypothetical protein